MSFFLIIMLVKYALSDGVSQAFLPFRFVDVIVITDHHLFWNVGPANCILKYFDNMMIDHSDSTILEKMADFTRKIHTISHKMAYYFAFPLLL